MATLLRKPGQGVQETASRELRWTSEQFYRAASAGVFDEPGRSDLIHGRINQKMPPSPLHCAVRVRMGRVLRSFLASGLTVIEECPNHIAFDGEPIPDVAAVRGPEVASQELYPQPDDVGLVVEIAVSSATSVLTEKALLYAQAAIGDYWVVLPETREIVAHREPTSAGYASVTRLGEIEVVVPLAASDARLPVRDLLGRCSGESELSERNGR